MGEGPQNPRHLPNWGRPKAKSTRNRRKRQAHGSRSTAFDNAPEVRFGLFTMIDIGLRWSEKSRLEDSRRGVDLVLAANGRFGRSATQRKQKEQVSAFGRLFRFGRSPETDEIAPEFAGMKGDFMWKNGPQARHSRTYVFAGYQQ